MSVTPERLARITDVQSLLDLLRDELDWPLDEQADLADVTFDYAPGELALRPEHQSRVREVKQLRPFDTDQDWAVFFVNFESGQSLPVTVLRRILHGLTIRNRQADAAAARSAWNRDDILFISSFGQGAEREVAFAHFHQGTGDLPRLDVLGWHEEDTGRRKLRTAERLEGLRYDDGEDADARRARWTQAFQGTKRQTIREVSVLVDELARLARAIRSRINELMAAETETGHLRRMHEAFRHTLIEGLSADEFADTFAQTMSYGLLTAAFAHGSGQLGTQDLVHMVPATNPFLRGLFERFLRIGGRDEATALDYDEVGLGEVITLLQTTDLEAVRADFGSRRPGEDPVIHFYEQFLAAYDNRQRVKRGVFYTPQPVVSFIVRGVDQVLREEFGLPLGLADTATWGEVATRLPRVEVPAGVDPASPFVRILDPATGTGTFLVEAIDLIERRMKEQWTGRPELERHTLWQTYVERHLLPRLTGFELMMAPYAIAHMKVGLKLADTGYDLAAGQRLRVFLANTMQPAREAEQREMNFDVEVLAREAEAANAAKRDHYTVVIGNPPYSGHSQNNASRWIVNLVHDYKRDWPDLLKPGQAKWLQDDYVKFIRFAQREVERAGTGVLGFVTNHSFLDNPTFKGMRSRLLATFDSLRLLDLHGNFKKKETAPDGSKDENVFEGVGQGVAISILAKGAGEGVFRADLWGQEAAKLASLGARALAQAGFAAFEPLAPQNLFAARDAGLFAEYEPFAALPAIMDQNGDPAPGIVTTHDEFAVSFTPEEQVGKVEALLATASEAEARGVFRLCSQDQWSYAAAKRELPRTDWRSQVAPLAYRPFDTRFTVWNGHVAVHRRERATSHMIGSSNIAVATSRGVEGQAPWTHALAFDQPIQHHSVSLKEVNYFLPLFLRPAAGETHRRSNLSLTFARTLAARTGLGYVDGLPRRSSDARGQVRMDELAPPIQPSLLDAGAGPGWDGRGDLRGTFGPRDVFDYVYAVLHAPSYRARYAEFLRSDFPRIPLPGGADPAGLFRTLAAHGRRLTALHLLDVDAIPELRAPAVRLAGTGSMQLGTGTGTPRRQDDKVWINDARWFEPVPEAVWTFQVGGYQPAQKWLKDRAGKGGANPRVGRTLTDEDVLHYRRFTTALGLTIPEMSTVDATIAEHGGWPDAFLAREERRAAS